MSVTKELKYNLINILYPFAALLDDRHFGIFLITLYLKA